MTMKKIILFIFTIFTLNSFADRSPATSREPNEDTARSSAPETDAGTTVIGMNCTDCKALEKAGKAKTLNDARTIFRPGDATTSGSSGSGNSANTDQ